MVAAMQSLTLPVQSGIGFALDAKRSISLGFSSALKPLNKTIVEHSALFKKEIPLSR
jgi:hypothetical protein